MKILIKQLIQIIVKTWHRVGIDTIKSGYSMNWVLQIEFFSPLEKCVANFLTNVPSNCKMFKKKIDLFGNDQPKSRCKLHTR